MLISVLLFSCSPNREPESEPRAETGSPVTLAPASTSTDRFEVEAWVDKPAPARDERVTVSGSLIKNGVYLGGIMMQATWPEAAQERGVPNCYVLVIYQRGVCTIEAGSYPSGEFVPVTITFEYKGIQYSGQTGFTPR
jgi:hypothetical protein